MITNTIFSAVNPNASSPRNNPSLAGLITAIQNEIGNNGGIEDTLIQGYIREAATVTFAANNSFTVSGNVTAYYTAGRVLRINAGGTPIYVTVLSSSFSVNTTVTVQETTVPNPVNTVDLAIQPKGYTTIKSGSVVFGGTSGQYLKSNGDGTLSYSGLTINRAFSFFVAGVVAVANDVSWDPTVPQNMTGLKLWASCKTAPTGTPVILQVYNTTQARIVGQVTISTGTITGNNGTLTNAGLNQGDVLRFDVVQADSNNVGQSFSVVLEATQP